MKREAQPTLSAEGQQALDQYACVLHQVEDLSAVPVRNYPSDVLQFMAWCEDCWREEQDEHSFTPQAIAPPLPIRYRTDLQTTLWLKPSTVNQAGLATQRGADRLDITSMNCA